MLAVEKSKTHKGKCTPNVLPCRINHNGAVNTSKRYWNPTKTADGKTVAYFRGRKLHGRKLHVPDGYRGVVMLKTDRLVPKKVEPEVDAEDLDEEPEVKIMEEKSDFDGIVVWGHEALPDGIADPYVRGIEEWVAFAEQIHSFDSKDEESPSK